MKIVAVVPIKLNNMRLPNKNIKEFDNGKPLCCYVLETLLSVKDIDAVYVYCSNELIKKYIPSGVKYLKRDNRLDSNETSMNEVLYEFAKEVQSEAYLLAHATSPFLKQESIEKGIEAMKGGSFDSAFTVKKLQEFLWKDDEAFNYNPSNIPRTQDLPPLYCETSGYYIFHADTILKENRRIGDKPFMVEVGEMESIDIDEPEDFEIANAIYNHILMKKGETHEGNKSS